VLWNNNLEAFEIKDNGKGDMQVVSPDEPSKVIVGFDSIKNIK